MVSREETHPKRHQTDGANEKRERPQWQQTGMMRIERKTGIGRETIKITIKYLVSERERDR